MIATSRQSLRRLRLAGTAARAAVWLLAAAGAAASIRAFVAPARPVVRAAPVERADRAAEALAAAFARAYLTLDGGHPDAVRDQLAAITGDASATAIDADAPPIVRQRVRWVETVATRPLGHGRRLVTLAAETDRLGLVHLAVTVSRSSAGALHVVGAPALVGGPIIRDADAEPDARRPEVTDQGLSEVVRRALGNYLAGAGHNLAADLSASARVTLPDVALRLERLRDLRWMLSRRSLAASVEASDRDGVRYALRYELDVIRAADRWEIAAIGSDPTV